MAGGYGVGDAAYVVAVHRLSHVYQLPGLVFGNRLVQVGDIGDTYDAVELEVARESVIHLLLRHGAARLVGTLRVRRHEEEALLVRHEVEDSHHAGVWRERAAVAVAHAVERIVYGVQVVQRLEQPHLVGKTLAAELLYDILGEPLLAHHGEGLRSELLHIPAQRAEVRVLLCRHGLAICRQQTAVEATADAVLHAQRRPREQLVYSRIQHHAQRPHVYAAAAR